jgi:hypothetical protein
MFSPQLPRTLTTDVIAELARFGTKTGEFVQGWRGDASLAAGQVDEGFCRGVCLDWARRVLQVQPARRTPEYLSFSPHPEHATAQTKLQAAVQKNLDGRRIVASTTNERRTAVFDDLRSLYNGNLTRQNVTVQDATIAKLDEFLALVPRPSGEISMDRVLRCIEILREQIESANNNTEVSWRSFAESIDESHREQRTSDSRGAEEDVQQNPTRRIHGSRAPHHRDRRHSDAPFSERIHRGKGGHRRL